MKQHLPIVVALLLWLPSNSQPLDLKSPNGNIKVVVKSGTQLTFGIEYKGIMVIENAQVAMDLGGVQIPASPIKIKSVNKRSATETRELVVPSKDKSFTFSYNELTVTTNLYNVQFRTYDDGFAYRFVTKLGANQIDVVNEQLVFSFPVGSTSFFPREKSLYSHFEQSYSYMPVDSVAEGDFCALPVRFDVPGGVGVLITEADHFDYPGLFLSKDGASSFRSKFPAYPLEIVPLQSRPDRYEVIKKEATYIARTSGTRTYPWRIFMVSDDDRSFVESNLVMQLSRPSVLKDTEWIKPGKVAWDWYNANNVYGVDFESGINNETYKYYIDFASANGLEYVILDEGWTKTTTQVMESTPEINVPELVAHARERNVGIILWILWHPLDKNTEQILQLYSSWGVKGIKVDFMQRADQYMVKSYEEIARIAAKYQLLVDFHGAFKPAGLRSAYPNVLTYEGVMGNENNKWGADITPEHNVTLPFTRMVAGPMDYTPGAMSNAQKRDFNVSFYTPMSQGTRCHQVAMYVVYESPLQMLCDLPTVYMKDQTCTNFISKIPSTWDETIVLEGKIADYIVIARRKGANWYIGAMTDWSPRSFELDLSFLKFGNFSMEVIRDGVNASKFAEDYAKDERQVNSKSIVKIDMAPGGGWVAILIPDSN